MDGDSEVETVIKDVAKVIEMNPWLTVEQLSAKEGVTPRTIFRWLKNEKVESRLNGDKTFYRIRPDIPDDEEQVVENTADEASDGLVTDRVITKIVDMLSSQLALSQQDLRSARDTIESQRALIAQLEAELELLRRKRPNALGRLKRALDILLGRAGIGSPR